jgi:hypothetical protein
MADEEKLMLKPHSLDPAALDATDSTLKMLFGGGPLVRTESGVVKVTDGWVECACANPSFVEFAAVRQGYVADARVEDV